MVVTAAGGTSGYADGNPGTTAKFNYTAGMVSTPDAINLYAADLFNNRIRKVQLPVNTTGAVENFSGDYSDMLYAYPNPARADEINLFIDFPFNEPFVKVSVFDFTGRQVYCDSTVPVMDKKVMLKLNSLLADGIYYCLLQSGSGRSEVSASARIVVSKY